MGLRCSQIARSAAVEVLLLPTPPRSPGSARGRARFSLFRGGGTGRPEGGGRRGARWAGRAATALSVGVLGVAGVGHVLVGGLTSDIARVDPFKDMKNRPQGGDGMNILLVGTDGRDRLTPEEKRRYRLGGEPCHCTDTVMIVHLSADRDRASVVSLPRDSYAETPAHTDHTTGERHGPHPVKLNAAYAEGGPELTVRTVEHMTHVRIDHYLEVDFVSFMRTVDVLGGVELCTARPLKDAYTGLDLPAGKHDLNGGQALQYVRSRHVDGAADLGRMQRQQRFMAALIARAGSSGVLLNPVKFRAVTRAVLGSVRADEGFGADELVGLGRAMRSFSPASSEFTTVPVGNVAYPVEGIGSTVKWDDRKAEKVFAALREDRPLAPYGGRRPVALVDVAPERIRVQVENGTAAAGLAERVDAALAATGFRTTGAPVNSQEHGVRRTVVAYDPGWDRSAKSLAAALPGSVLRSVPGQGATLRVIVGSESHRVRGVRVDAAAEAGSDPVRGDEVVCGG
ncbi:LytR family transcriptional regulator [Streptomyces minutiscleroticus]|uniref:LytR family transcriptional regulator n=1 Tax=Streptomyces minutiscleroticus TaxID=68238 RepID=A0A918KFD3_9ACTN|nr:LytR family transcriptional regulator [Streptomyces minutiscleroticus]